MRILIVEHEQRAARRLEKRLAAEGMSSDVTYSGGDAIALAKLYDFDLIVLDLCLPDMTGFLVLRELRERHISTPVLAISGEAGVERMVRCFNLGADDFLAKPYKGEELVARVRAIVRRTHGHSVPVVRCGDLTLDIDARKVMAHGKEVVLTHLETQMIVLMFLRKGVTVSKDTFINQLYGGLGEREPKIIDVYICKLRKRFATLGIDPEYITTVRGRGYVLRPPHAAGAITMNAAA